MSEPPGLDYAFLRYVGVQSQTQRHIQKVYLPYFAGCQRIADLGCGDGDFVALLAEHGHEVLGVDRDPQMVAHARSASLPVAEADVFDWLATEAETVERDQALAWDGVFSAHLVEHLPYQQVLTLCAQAWRILRPGGVIVLTTPNVAALQAHLDGYYKHFGHLTFYHPDLLRFFLSRSGFEVLETGANDNVPSTLFFPVLRQLNEHQVELDRIEAVSNSLLPEHSTIAEVSQANHKRFVTVFAVFSELHERFQAIQGTLDTLRKVTLSAPATPSTGIPDGSRQNTLRRLVGRAWNRMTSVSSFKSNALLEQLQRAAQAVAQLNCQVALMAELWQQSQTITDQLNGLLAKQGTLVRDTARTNRQMESAMRSLIQQVDKPFEAFVIARKPEVPA
jgi:SAM-dependent methyltransferase